MKGLYYGVQLNMVCRVVFVCLMILLSFVILKSNVYASLTETDSVVAEESESDVEEGLEESSFTYEDAKDMMGWSNSDLLKIVEYSEAFIFEDAADEDYDTIGNLTLKNGLNRPKISTFSSSKTLSGTATSGSIVGVNVFYVNEELDDTSGATIKVVMNTQKRANEIGLSGLFSETIQLDHVGTNYVLISVINPDEDTAYYNLYKIIRLEETTKNKLENLKIDFLEEDEEDSSSDSLLPEFTELPL